MRAALQDRFVGRRWARSGEHASHRYRQVVRRPSHASPQPLLSLPSPDPLREPPSRSLTPSLIGGGRLPRRSLLLDRGFLVALSALRLQRLFDGVNHSPQKKIKKEKQGRGVNHNIQSSVCVPLSPSPALILPSLHTGHARTEGQLHDGLPCQVIYSLFDCDEFKGGRPDVVSEPKSEPKDNRHDADMVVIILHTVAIPPEPPIKLSQSFLYLFPQIVRHSCRRLTPYPDTHPRRQSPSVQAEERRNQRTHRLVSLASHAVALLFCHCFMGSMHDVLSFLLVLLTLPFPPPPFPSPPILSQKT